MTRRKPGSAHQEPSADGVKSSMRTGAEVHGMADEAIRSAGDDALPFFDLDGARGELFSFMNPKGDQIAGEDEELGRIVSKAGRETRRNGNPIRESLETRRQPTGPSE